MKGPVSRFNGFELAWRMPMLVWQTLFFIGPLLFMIAMTFFLVKNYRMTEAFEMKNWIKMMTRGFFWDSFFLTFQLALISTITATIIAFPASYFLSYKLSENARRMAIFFLIVPFFTSYLVRTFSWYIILAEKGVVNAIFGLIGLGPYTILNTPLATLIGYMTFCLPLVIILQTLSLANVDKNLIEASWNLGCGRMKTLFRVILPSAKTGLIIAAVFCFILSYGDFVAPYYLGGSKPPTLSILIVDTTKSGQQWPRAAVVAVMMMITLLTVAFAAIMFAYREKK